MGLPASPTHRVNFLEKYGLQALILYPPPRQLDSLQICKGARASTTSFVVCKSPARPSATIVWPHAGKQQMASMRPLIVSFHTSCLLLSALLCQTSSHKEVTCLDWLQPGAAREVGAASDNCLHTIERKYRIVGGEEGNFTVLCPSPGNSWQFRSRGSTPRC